MGISINRKELTNLMKSFYELAKIRIVFFDENFNELFGYPDEYAVFCHTMRQNPDFKRRCDASVEKCADNVRPITALWWGSATQDSPRWLHP